MRGRNREHQRGSDTRHSNERFARANIKSVEIRIFSDNVAIFDEIANGAPAKFDRRGMNPN
jgi:hypothetical protein